jgi:hypothetical protein
VFYADFLLKVPSHRPREASLTLSLPQYSTFTGQKNNHIKICNFWPVICVPKYDNSAFAPTKRRCRYASKGFHLEAAAGIKILLVGKKCKADEYAVTMIILFKDLLSYTEVGKSLIG